MRDDTVTGGEVDPDLPFRIAKRTFEIRVHLLTFPSGPL
jgi:hypothetical protein